MSFNLKTPRDVSLGLRDRFKARRLALNLSQSGLADRSGVNLQSLRRFEKAGLVSLESLLKIALVLGVLDGFDTIANFEPMISPALGSELPRGLTLDGLLASKPTRRRGRIT